MLVLQVPTARFTALGMRYSLNAMGCCYSACKIRTNLSVFFCTLELILEEVLINFLSFKLPLILGMGTKRALIVISVK